MKIRLALSRGDLQEEEENKSMDDYECDEERHLNAPKRLLAEFCVSVLILSIHPLRRRSHHKA